MTDSRRHLARRLRLIVVAVTLSAITLVLVRWIGTRATFREHRELRPVDFTVGVDAYGIPNTSYAAVDPALIPALEALNGFDPPDALRVVAEGVPPIGVYLPITGDTQFSLPPPTLTPVILPSATSTRVSLPRPAETVAASTNTIIASASTPSVTPTVPLPTATRTQAITPYPTPMRTARRTPDDVISPSVESTMRVTVPPSFTPAVLPTSTLTPTAAPLPTAAPIPVFIPDDEVIPPESDESVEVALAPSVTPVVSSDTNDCAPSGWPVAGTLTQYYHWYHRGIDLGIPLGTAVVAPHSGMVLFAGWRADGYGNLIIIQNGIFITYYGHLSDFNVSTGQLVGRGSVIGFSGSTGNSSGPHVHYEIRINDVEVDPLTFENRGYSTC